MTFAARTIMGMTHGGPVPFSVGLINTSISLGVRAASLNLVNDGTTTRTPNGGGGNVAGPNWYDPAPSAGIGATVWCKLVINTSSGTTIGGSPTNTVQTVGGTGWSFTSSGTNVEGSGTGTLTFYGNSGGTNLLATADVSWDVGYTP